MNPGDLTPKQLDELLLLLIEEGEYTRAELSVCNMFISWQEGPEKRELESQIKALNFKLNAERSEVQRLQRLVLKLEEDKQQSSRYINSIRQRLDRITLQNSLLYNRLREIKTTKKKKR